MKEIKKPAKDQVKTGLFTLLILLLSCISVFSQNVGINATGAVPNAAAGLDVDFPNKGVLIPRVALTGTASFAPLTAHVAGMVVYNTATAGDVTPGLYYNDGTKWIPGKMAGTAAGNMLYWNGSAWAPIPAGSAGQYLTLNESGIPTWTYATVAGNYATLTTTNVSAITATTATTGGNITNDGGMPVLTRGVCYGTSPNPTTSNSVSTASPATGVGTYTNNLTGLLSGTTYYVRAFATNSTVTSYGNETSFTTLASAPTVTTTAATAVTASTATSGGNVTANGGAGITERGIVYSTSVNPTIITGTKVIDGTPGTGIFISNISGLSGGTLYHVRAYATNSINTSYGSDLTFTTTVAPPTLQTTAVTNVSGASVTSGGSMTWNGGGYSNYQYYGICYSTVPNSASPTYVNTNSSNYPVNPAVNIAPWVTNITGLAANTTYYIRSFLYVYKSGWSYVYGNEISFTTSAPSAPIVGTTTAISAITASTATSGGTITTDGGSAITAKGVCWGTNPSPTLGVSNFTNMGAGTGAFGSNITGLTGNTTYYVRSYATNGVGTSYGPEQSFKTCATPAYNIGDQVGGGIVFYVNCDGSGLIASTEDQSASVIWGCSGVNIGTSANLGTGAANTAAILNGCATRPIAASVASSYNGGGFTDWYLPSSQELYQMMQKNAMLNMYGQYWTSSDGTSTTTAAMYYYINNLQFSSAMKNTSLLKVRAIRSFSAPTLPSVTTDVVSNVAGTSATCGGNVTNDGGAPILAAGVCWSTTSGPTIADSKTNDASVTGPFNSSLTGLTFPTTYYVRAYVTNGAGTSYGNEVSFTTITVNLATVTTDAITNLLGTSATTGGNVTADGGSTVTDRGVCWDITSNPDLNNLSGSGGKLSDAVGGLGTFISNITGLVTDQQYYVRAFAINDAGIAYGSDIPFTPTGNTIPTLTTVAVTSPTPTGGISGGAITSTGGEPITVSGICWSDVNYPPTIADNKTTDGILTTGNFASTLTGLVAGTQYNIRAYATNSLGTAYGDEVFYIPVDLPTLAISPLAYYIPDTYAQLPISVSN
ncbi:MAG TPA: hypothetical protein VK205_06220, partial [Prolixibacteraceae bacterium]|nr:hypothetical protein [Prolixibacteraceae bacterium]